MSCYCEESGNRIFRGDRLPHGGSFENGDIFILNPHNLLFIYERCKWTPLVLNRPGIASLRWGADDPTGDLVATKWSTPDSFDKRTFFAYSATPGDTVTVRIVLGTLDHDFTLSIVQLRRILLIRQIREYVANKFDDGYALKFIGTSQFVNTVISYDDSEQHLVVTNNGDAPELGVVTLELTLGEPGGVIFSPSVLNPDDDSLIRIYSVLIS